MSKIWIRDWWTTGWANWVGHSVRWRSRIWTKRYLCFWRTSQLKIHDGWKWFQCRWRTSQLKCWNWWKRIPCRWSTQQLPGGAVGASENRPGISSCVDWERVDLVVGLGGCDVIRVLNACDFAMWEIRAVIPLVFHNRVINSWKTIDQFNL